MSIRYRNERYQFGEMSNTHNKYERGRERTPGVHRSGKTYKPETGFDTHVLSGGQLAAQERKAARERVEAEGSKDQFNIQNRLDEPVAQALKQAIEEASQEKNIASARAHVDKAAKPAEKKYVPTIQDARLLDTPKASLFSRLKSFFN